MKTQPRGRSPSTNRQRPRGTTQQAAMNTESTRHQKQRDREGPTENNPLCHHEDGGTKVFFETHERRKFAGRWIRTNATVETEKWL